MRGGQVAAPGIEHPLVTTDTGFADYFDLREVGAVACCAIDRMAGDVVNQYGFTGIVARAAKLGYVFSLAMWSVAGDTRSVNLSRRMCFADDITVAFGATGFASDYRALMRLMAPITRDIVRCTGFAEGIYFLGCFILSVATLAELAGDASVAFSAHSSAREVVAGKAVV